MISYNGWQMANQSSEFLALRAKARLEQKRRAAEGYRYTVERVDQKTFAVTVEGAGVEFTLYGTELLLMNLGEHPDVGELQRGIIHEGSTSSSKTYSTMQRHVIETFMERKKLIKVIRKTMPALKDSAMYDLRRILDDEEHEQDLWKYFHWHKTENTFTNVKTGSIIQFKALDNPQKARGPRQDESHLVEANELSKEDFKQIARRTNEKIFLDYNPSMLSSHIYDNLIPRDDFHWQQSTYKINPFLTDEIIREIEEDVPVYKNYDTGEEFVDWNNDIQDGNKESDGWYLIKGDPFEWDVYGLGRRGSPTQAIYKRIYESEGLPGRDSVYCLDFGYTHYMCLAEIERVDREIQELHIDQIIFEKHLTTGMLIAKMDALGVDKDKVIYCDGARPDAIQELVDAGYNAVAADKSPGSVIAGINYMKDHKLMFTGRSGPMKAQFQDYRWKKRPDGSLLDEPIKLEDDAPDAVRYGLYTHWGEGYVHDGVIFG